MKIKFAWRDGGIILAVLTVLTFLSARGADTNYTGADWALMDTQKALTAAAEITPKKYPNCDEATVDQKSVRVYRADGTGESQDESFTKILTEKGRHDNRSLSFGFMLPYWTVSIPKLEIIKPDGKVEPVDVAANSKESIDNSQMAENIYDPNMRVLQVNIPKLDIGDVVHLVVRQTTLRAIMPGEFSDENVFEGSGYIRHITYEVHAPDGHPLKRIALRDEIPGTVTSSVTTNADHSLTYDWEVKNVPRMYDEPDMPPYDNVLQRLIVSTTTNWQAISRWYWNLSLPHLDAVTPALKQKVSELTADQETAMDKIHALFYYVSKKIRYAGLTFEKNRPGFEPHDVSITFDKQYGVCRDKAGLLVEMLRLAGFKSYPVFINIGSKLDSDVPEIGFNHAIVSVELGTNYLLMDPTDENTRDLLPAYDADRSYLVCRPEGETLLTSPVPPVDQHLMVVKTTGTLRADGHLDAKTELAFNGVNDDEYRNAFSRMKPDDRQRFFERALKAAIPGAKLESFKLTPKNVLDASQKLRAELDFSADGLTVLGDGKAVVSLPWVGKHFGIVNFLLTGASLDKRKYPLDTGYTCGLQENVSIKLAGGFSGAAAMPTASSVDDQCLSYAQNVKFEDDSLEAARELKLKTVEFSPAQYLELKQTLKDMQYDARKNPILTAAAAAMDSEVATNDSAPAPVNSNAEVLESSKKLQVIDAHTATYFVKYAKRILTYDGKKREAEVKIPYNPACESVKFIRGAVTSKSGERQQVSPDEINVMDQGWNPSAKRYTGGKILVANLPGVEIGSTIEVAYAVTITNKPFLAGYEPFQLVDALDKKSFELIAPTNVEIQKLRGGTSGAVTESNQTVTNAQIFDWSAENVKALPAETQLPPEWDFAGVSYFIGNVTNYWRNLNSTMLARAQNSSNTAALAHKLTDGLTNRLDKIKAIRDFAAKSIRRAGPLFTALPLSELSAADTTLADGYGHAADSAILLYAMLSAAGFQPEFVLASDLPPINGVTNVTDSFPLPQEFVIPLVRVRVDGQMYYLNDTSQYAQLGTTPADGKLGLVLADQKIETIHAATNCEDRAEVVYAMSLGDDGRARITITHNYYGESYNVKHRYFAELPPEERNRYFQKIVSAVAQGAQPVGDLKTEFDTYPGREQFTVDVDKYAVVDGKYFYFDLPSVPALFPVGADHRELPLFIPGSISGTVRTEITLPPKFQQRDIEPKTEVLAVPGGTRADIVRTDANGQCVITDQFKIASSIIQPGDYPAVLKTQSALAGKSARLFLLEQN